MHASLELRTRGFSEADAGFVRELGKEAFGEFSEDPAVSTLWMAEHYTSLIATMEGIPVGIAILHFGSKRATPELMAIAVVKRQRGRGVGASLLAAAERLASDRGARKLALHTAEANLSALDLFLKRGFRIQARCARYYRNTIDACELIKVL